MFFLIGLATLALLVLLLAGGSYHDMIFHSVRSFFIILSRVCFSGYRKKGIICLQVSGAFMKNILHRTLDYIFLRFAYLALTFTIHNALITLGYMGDSSQSGV